MFQVRWRMYTSDREEIGTAINQCWARARARVRVRCRINSSEGEEIATSIAISHF